MSAAPETFSIGTPVEIGKIERELKKLWEEGGEAITRASLVNLAVYSEAPGSLARNTQIVAAVSKLKKHLNFWHLAEVGALAEVIIVRTR